MPKHDMTFMREAIITRLGPNARPSGGIRFLKCGPEARLQAEFFSELGCDWIDVPIIEVDVMPPRDFPPITPAKSRAARKAAAH